MLVEHGFVRAQLPDGREWTFTPSIGRIAELGTPAGIVELYAALHGPRAPRLAREVLAALCDQDDATELIGWLDLDTGTEHDGAMPVEERVILARHLMQHGICGKPEAAKAADGGSYSSTFDAAQFIAMARVHLGMTQAEAAGLSMTELQQLMRVKFPPQDGSKAKNVPSRAEYEAAMKRLKERRGE
jgi:hypothetical protein